MELDAEVYPSIFDAFADAFLLAAIPEELAKLIMLWLLLRKNPHFDEKFDGIVYAVCIGGDVLAESRENVPALWPLPSL